MDTILNTHQQHIAQYLAKKRWENCHDRGAETTVYEKGAIVVVKGCKGIVRKREYEAMGGEMAFCKLHNLWPEIDPETIGVEDCKLPNNLRVDVKTTDCPTGRLLVKAIAHAEDQDVFALMIVKWPHYRYAGLILAAEMLREERLAPDLKKYPCYAANQNELEENWRCIRR